jgi:hypothetical protein
MISAMADLASVVVAGAAVVVSAVVQFVTLRESRRSLKEERVAGRRNVISQLRADDTRAWIAKLCGDIADWSQLTYDMETRFDRLRRGNGELDDEYMEWATRENILWTRMMINIDPDGPHEAELIEAMRVMRDLEFDQVRRDTLWIDRRDEILRRARAVFVARRKAMLSE